MNPEDAKLLTQLVKTFDDFEKRIIKNLPQSEFDRLSERNLNAIFRAAFLKESPTVFCSELGMIIRQMFALRAPDIYRRIKEERAN